MRHRVAGRRLGRDSAHRAALRKNLIKSLLQHERIRTTKAKALAVRPDAEKMITLAKRAQTKREADQVDVHEWRQAAAVLQDQDLVYKLFHDIAPRYMERPGGYTRMLKLGPRKGDNSEMVILELV